MTEQEKYELLGELKDLAEWMQDSAPCFDVNEYESIEEQIKSLNQDCGYSYKEEVNDFLKESRNGGTYLKLEE